LLHKCFLKKLTYGPITNILYIRDSGLIITTFDGTLLNYDSMEFKLIWEMNENSHNIDDKFTMTICAYSHKLAYICVGGIEGKLVLYDISAKIKITEVRKHYAEIVGIFFYDQ
jgi:hypothetical protein